MEGTAEVARAAVVLEVGKAGHSESSSCTRKRPVTHADRNRCSRFHTGRWRTRSCLRCRRSVGRCGTGSPAPLLRRTCSRRTCRGRCTLRVQTVDATVAARVVGKAARAVATAGATRAVASRVAEVAVVPWAKNRAGTRTRAPLPAGPEAVDWEPAARAVVVWVADGTAVAEVREAAGVVARCSRPDQRSACLRVRHIPAAQSVAAVRKCRKRRRRRRRGFARCHGRCP